MWGKNRSSNKSDSKYGNKKTHYAGFSFSSKFEAAVYGILLQRQEAGEISDIKVQQRVYFFKGPDIYYIPDFSWVDNATQALCYTEAKGFVKPEFIIKKKLWIHLIPNRLEIYTGSHLRPKLYEVING